jgi:kynureninase
MIIERAGTVTIQPPHAYEVSRELIARQVVVDYREGAGIRIAPHFYNTDAEIEDVMSLIEEILINDLWQKHQSGRTFVT